MNPLPFSPLDSLHIFPPGMLLLLFLAIFLGLALLLPWWWWRRHRQKATTSQRTTPEVRTNSGDGGGFAQIVRSIREEHLARKTYREGCHALSAATKSQLERGTGAEAEEMTVDEITTWSGERGLASFFTQLRRHQFGKQPPDRDDFKKMCRQAPKVTGRHTPPDGKA